jgi:hypothetical protein
MNDKLKAVLAAILFVSSLAAATSHAWADYDQEMKAWFEQSFPVADQ